MMQQGTMVMGTGPPPGYGQQQVMYQQQPVVYQQQPVVYQQQQPQQMVYQQQPMVMQQQQQPVTYGSGPSPAPGAAPGEGTTTVGGN